MVKTFEEVNKCKIRNGDIGEIFADVSKETCKVKIYFTKNFI